jgi:hypothetical protein
MLPGSSPSCDKTNLQKGRTCLQFGPFAVGLAKERLGGYCAVLQPSDRADAQGVLESQDPNCLPSFSHVRPADDGSIESRGVV